ncbi:MAG: HDIG domain-containing protein [Lentisphaerae bacterium]|nr:HDIG domain-containing protein [Lentisphaerota bacterium]
MGAKKFLFWRRNNAPGKPFIDRKYIEDTLAVSPVPIVLICVLVWAVSSVLLLLSENQQRDLTVWVDGQRAPFSVWARTDFAYVDTGATEKLRQEAAAQALKACRIDRSIEDRIAGETKMFLNVLGIENAAADAGNKPGVLRAEKLVYRQEIAAQVKEKHPELLQKLKDLTDFGIAGEEISKEIDGRKVTVIRPVSDAADDVMTYELIPPSAEKAAGELTGLLKLSGEAADEFKRMLTGIFAGGTLSIDQAATAAAAEKEMAKVVPVLKRCRRGTMLIERQHLITRETVDMFEAEKLALPGTYGLALLGNQLFLAVILLLIALFFLYRTYPGIFKAPRRFSVGGCALIIALVVNFIAMQIFFYLFRHGKMVNYELMLFIIPVPFGAALLSILLGNRTALFAGFIIASISSLMILPDRSFELALRWFAISALMAFFTRNVTNYRSFFVRVFIGSVLLTVVVNCDVIHTLVKNMRLEAVKVILYTVAGNAFFCAVAALLMVFAFELIFNVDTSMSLMVLSDFNHPLLEKLKREAPGTMFHSMTVATLAEDAARAIKANAAKAKAGALFHDIGKLAMPEYFVENNVDSPKEYMKMPPQRSCGIIRGHVKEGLKLAREYRLSSFIREVIATHHGDDLISFFYRLAKENSSGDEGQVLEAQFRYDGPPPASKEATVISLADACEAASRSLNKPAPAKLEALVNEIFIGRLRGGQLRNSELTASELNIVRECFIADLISFNHGRIAYKKESADDSAALPLAEPSTAAAEEK